MGFFKKKEPAVLSAPVSGPVEYVICGLGNPGSKYGNTRHNIGFCALDVLAKDCGAAVERSRFHAVTGEAMLAGRHVLLMKPATYMNLSGQAVQEAMRFYKLPPQRLIVLSDDISLPVGKMRIRTKGSAGGHNGLKDIILKLGSDEFPRIKFGVGEKPNPEYDLADWVGEAVVELVRPIREKTEQLLSDKSYLESIYKEGAERASYLANKTLRKVYKKVGFVAK